MVILHRIRRLINKGLNKTRTYANVTNPVFGAVGDGITDDTQAFKNAIQYAVENKTRVYIPNGKYLITDTLSIGSETSSGTPSERIEILGEHMRETEIIFNPPTQGKPIVTLDANSGYTVMDRMTLKDGQVRKNIGIKMIDYYDDAGRANWKNHFSRVHFSDFDKTMIFEGGDSHTQDTHLDGTTFYKCAFWNYNIGIEVNNVQAVQTSGIDVDFITDFSGDENSIAIVNNCGTTFNFTGGSWISRGTFMKFNATTDYYSSKYTLDNVRFEFRYPYNNPAIAFSDRTEGFPGWDTSTVIDLELINCSGAGRSEDITLIKTPVVGNVRFKDCLFNNGDFHADVYQTSETIASSGDYRGSKGKLLFDGCSTININMIEDNGKYTVISGLVPDVKVLNQYHSSSSFSTRIDEHGFYRNLNDSYEISRDRGMVDYSPKYTGIRIAENGRLPNELKLRLPSFAIPLSIVIPKAIFNHDTLIEYYAVKDISKWDSQSVFNIDTDSLKLGEYDLYSNDGSGHGNIKIPIEAPSNISSIVGTARTLKTDKMGEWKEGRFMIRFVNKSTGELLNSGHTPLEYTFIEYI